MKIINAVMQGRSTVSFGGVNPNFHTRIPVIIKREFPVGSAQDYFQFYYHE